jgi:hypothetical protein
MRKIGDNYGMAPLDWKVSPFVYAHMEVANTPVGPIRVRMEPRNEGCAVILPPALSDGAPSSLGTERSRINRPSMEAAKEAAEERYYLHVRSILSGSWNMINWKRAKDCVGEQYVGISHFGRWKIGFLYETGPRMGYVTSPVHTDDPRSPRPYYPHASLDDLKETVKDLNVALAKKAVVYIEDAYRSMIKKDGDLKKLNWETLGKRRRLKSPVGDIMIAPASDEDPEPTYVCKLPWMVKDHLEAPLEPEADLEVAKQKVEAILQTLALRFTQ